MTSLKRAIVLEVTSIIQELQNPLTNSEKINGWRNETKARWSKNFEHILSSVTFNKPAPIASIARAMDFDGIYEGKLFEQAARISCLLQERTVGNDKNA